MPYQNFVVDPKLKKDVWVRASQVRPGNPSVVHHLVVFVIPPGSRDRAEDRLPGRLRAGMPPRILPEGVGQARPGRLAADVPGPLHPARHPADRSQRDRPGLRRPQDDPQGDDRDRRHQHGAAHPGRRRRLRGRGRASLRPGHDPLLAPAPHAPARQVVPVRGGLPRRPSRGAAGRAAVRVRMAERLCPLPAQAHARGERAALPGPIRQLGRQPVEPRPEARRSPGASRRATRCSSATSRSPWPTRTCALGEPTARKLDDGRYEVTFRYRPPAGTQGGLPGRHLQRLEAHRD